MAYVDEPNVDAFIVTVPFFNGFSVDVCVCMFVCEWANRFSKQLVQQQSISLYAFWNLFILSVYIYSHLVLFFSCLYLAQFFFLFSRLVLKQFCWLFIRSEIPFHSDLLSIFSETSHSFERYFMFRWLFFQFHPMKMQSKLVIIWWIALVLPLALGTDARSKSSPKCIGKIIRTRRKTTKGN